MKQSPPSFRPSPSRQSCRGQVLIFALIALIALLIAGLFLFDVHTVIKGKVKGQSAVDSAALTGAMWQMNALNLIGELNLIKATTVLTDERIFGVKNIGAYAVTIGENGESTGKDSAETKTTYYGSGRYVITQMLPPEAYYSVDADGGKTFDEDAFRADLMDVIGDYERLDDAVQLLTQMQTRVGFVLPLLGYAAAQQAAKNNGLTINDEVQSSLEDMYNDIGDTDLYGNPNLAPKYIYGYDWRQPYADMIQEIYQNGAAVGTAVERLGAPSLEGMRSFLMDKDFYSAVLARNWCKLRDILKDSYSGSWWGTFNEFTDDSFSGQSEILPLHLEHTSNSGNSILSHIPSAFPARYDSVASGGLSVLTNLYDSVDPYSGILKTDDTTGNLVIDDSVMEKYKSAGQPIHNVNDTDYRFNIIPEITWMTYGSEWYEYSEDFKDEWGEYLRADFRDGYGYQSGALAYFKMSQETKTLTGNLSDDDGGSVGDAFEFSGASGDIKSAESSLRNDVHKIETDAVAKPFGKIRADGKSYKPPTYAARLVLPVFTETALMPVALETIYGDAQTDRNWLLFLTEYLPILGQSNSLDAAWKSVSDKYPEHAHLFTRYHYALTLFDDPDFQSTGVEWLKKYSGRCNDWPSGGSGSRRGPGKIH